MPQKHRETRTQRSEREEKRREREREPIPEKCHNCWFLLATLLLTRLSVQVTTTQTNADNVRALSPCALADGRNERTTGRADAGSRQVRTGTRVGAQAGRRARGGRRTDERSSPPLTARRCLSCLCWRFVRFVRFFRLFFWLLCCFFLMWQWMRVHAVQPMTQNVVRTINACIENAKQPTWTETQAKKTQEKRARTIRGSIC